MEIEYLTHYLPVEEEYCYGPFTLYQRMPSIFPSGRECRARSVDQWVVNHVDLVPAE